MLRFPVLVGLMTLTGLASAATYYVSPTGNDTHAGTSAAPFLTIGKGLATASNGDTVIVASGTYTGKGNLDLALNGKSVNILATAGATINCNAGLVNNHQALTITGNNTSMTVSGITFEGAYSKNNGGAISVNSSNVLFTNCTFDNNQTTGEGGAIYCDSESGVALESCILNSNMAHFGGAIYVGGSATVTACNLLNNTDTEDGGAIGVDGSAAISGCTIESNSSDGGALYFDGNSGSVKNSVVASNLCEGIVIHGVTVQVSDCTVVGNSGYGLQGFAGGSSYVSTFALEDDILWGNTGGGVSAPSINELFCDDQGGVRSGQGNISVDPLFVSATNSNYQLENNSPCTHGKPIAGITTDILGHARHSIPTLGAYETGNWWSVIGSAMDPLTGNNRVLWTTTAGEAWLWLITPTGGESSVKYGPYAGYKPVAVAVGPDSRVYIAWQYGTNAIDLWSIDSKGNLNPVQYNPEASGWVFSSLTVDKSSNVRITWQSTAGLMWTWTYSPATGKTTRVEYGPFN